MIEAFAPAKVNLSLRVVGRRADGYHLLHSLVVFALDVGDQIRVDRPDPPMALDQWTLALEGPFGPALAADLNGRTGLIGEVVEVFAHNEAPLGFRIVLDKRLPIAAGLGGGSSDAAALMKLMLRGYGVDLTIDQVLGLASRFGSDAPACALAAPLIMEGIGDRLSVLPAWPEMFAVLANPGAPLPTADVFRHYAARGESFSIAPAPPGEVSTLESALSWLCDQGNDLEAAAIALAPAIAEAVQRMAAAPGCRLARMSGSGASVFGLFDDMSAARAAAETIQAQKPQWWVAPTRLGAVV